MLELDKKRTELAIVTDKLQVLYDNLAAKQIEQRVRLRHRLYEEAFQRLTNYFINLTKGTREQDKGNRVKTGASRTTNKRSWRRES